MTIEIHLRIVGSLLLALAGINLCLPRQLNWRRELRDVSLLNRQIFAVHAAFIALAVGLMGGLSLFYASHFTRPAPLAAAIASGMAVFWGARLLTQLFFYDPSHWRGNRARTAIHILVLLTLGYFTFTFARAGWICIGD
jgi:hypothetical protein